MPQKGGSVQFWSEDSGRFREKSLIKTGIADGHKPLKSGLLTHKGNCGLTWTDPESFCTTDGSTWTDPESLCTTDGSTWTDPESHCTTDGSIWTVKN